MKFFRGKFTLGMVVGTVLLASICVSKTVLAQNYSQSSGGPSIVVDKKVRPISDSNFYDNIDPNVKVFNEGEQIEFQITVTNNSNQNLFNLELKDILPQYLQLLFYPGVYNKTNRVITDEIGELDSGISNVYLVRGYVYNAPTTTLAEKKILQINHACASNNLVSDCDQADYYIAAKSVPPTGADDIGIKTAAILLVTISAVGLRKLARGY